MPKREIFLYVDDICLSCKKIFEYTKETDYLKFKKDLKTVDAVIRNLEIIGEAAKALPAEFRKMHKNIPWGKIIGMRNKVTHEYFGVDDKILWATITEDIPFLKREISKIKREFKNKSLF